MASYLQTLVESLALSRGNGDSAPRRFTSHIPPSNGRFPLKSIRVAAVQHYPPHTLASIHQYTPRSFHALAHISQTKPLHLILASPSVRSSCTRVPVSVNPVCLISCQQIAAILYRCPYIIPCEVCLNPPSRHFRRKSVPWTSPTQTHPCRMAAQAEPLTTGVWCLDSAWTEAN